MEFVDGVVDELDCWEEMDVICKTLDTGADRQLRRYEETGGDLKAVVDSMAEETCAGLF